MKETERKRWLCVVGCFAALAFLLSCGGGRERFAMPMGEAHQALSEIDSLMWRQPDSAFQRLQEFASSPLADSLDEFDRHYCQLLLSELLFKNYHKQDNRLTLLQAVYYFDTLCVRHVGNKRTVLTNPLVILDARAHYMKGVGYYECDSVVEACGEYLNALEIMEDRFGEKELIGKNAKFMAYTNNRLMEIFSAQYMMVPAIACGNQALKYCIITPTSPSCVFNILHHLGLQYNKLGDLYHANYYYCQAIERVSDFNCLRYRDLMSSKAFCDYQLGESRENALSTLRQVASQAENEQELLTRYLTMGYIFYEEKLFDSATSYLEPVFQKREDEISKIKAAEYLKTIYDNLGTREKSAFYAHFLADQKKSEGQNKALVSELESLFKDYTNQKLEKRAKEERNKAVRKTIYLLIPMMVLAAFIMLFFVIREGKRRMTEQQKKSEEVLEKTERRHQQELKLQGMEVEKRLEEKDQQLEIERSIRQKTTEELRQELRQKEEQLKSLESVKVQQRTESESRREAFLNEQLCRRIIALVRGRDITTRNSYYAHEVVLSDNDFTQLAEVVEKHFNGLDNALLGRCPGLNHHELELCHLLLLGLEDKEIAALRSRTYSSIRKQKGGLQAKLRINGDLSNYLLGMGGSREVSRVVPQDISQSILSIVSSNPKITRDEIAELLGTSTKTISRYLKKLNNKVRYVGSGYSGHWKTFNETSQARFKGCPSRCPSKNFPNNAGKNCQIIDNE